MPATRLPDTPEVAGRVFTFRERAETEIVARMRDLDEIFVSATALYPGHTWTRQEFLLLFFLDDIGDSLVKLVDQGSDCI